MQKRFLRLKVTSEEIGCDETNRKFCLRVACEGRTREIVINIRGRKYPAACKEATVVLRAVKFKRAALLPSRNFHIAFSRGSTFRLTKQEEKGDPLCPRYANVRHREVPFLLEDYERSTLVIVFPAPLLLYADTIDRRSIVSRVSSSDREFP